MIRVPKVEQRSCSMCSGSGQVEWTETFALRTEEEIGQSSLLRVPDYLDVPPGTERCITHSGATISAAVREGISLSKQIGKPVAFEFNGKIVIVRKNSNADAVTRRWWKAVYGETPEESRAKR